MLLEKVFIILSSQNFTKNIIDKKTDKHSYILHIETIYLMCQQSH